jgi:hypothetical protein
MKLSTFLAAGKPALKIVYLRLEGTAETSFIGFAAKDQ